MPKNPDRPKIKYKHVKKPPPPKKTPEELAAQKLVATEERLDISPQKVIAALGKAHGLLNEVAKRLNVPRTTLVRYIDKHPQCVEALNAARETMGDIAEDELLEKVKAGDLRAIIYYLSTVHGQSRNYRPITSNTAADNDRWSQVFVETVNIVGIPRGTFLPKKPDPLTIEH